MKNILNNKLFLVIIRANVNDYKNNDNDDDGDYDELNWYLI